MPDKYFTIEDAFEKNKDLNKDDVLALQNWMDKQPHLPEISEMKLIIFMHSCYYKIEATKSCIDNFYTLKAHWPEFALQRNVFSESMQQAFHIILATLLPARDKHNNYVVYGRLFDSNPDIFDYMNFAKAFDMISNIYLRVFGTADGHILVIDSEGATFSHIVKLNILALKKYLYYVQDALPVRLKAVHVINVAPVFNRLLTLAKPFLKKELMSIIHLHSKMDTFYDHIEKSNLPDELGGEIGSFKALHDKQMELVKEHAEYLLAEEKEVADESKRLEKSKYYDSAFGGVEGSFRKLDID